MKKQLPKDSEYENESHIAKKRKAEAKQSQNHIRSQRNMLEQLAVDEEDIDELQEYLRYIK